MSEKNKIALISSMGLQEPGDRAEAYITPTGNQVVKVNTSQESYTAVRYPTTGTIVKTESSKRIK